MEKRCRGIAGIVASLTLAIGLPPVAGQSSEKEPVIEYEYFAEITESEPPECLFTLRGAKGCKVHVVSTKCATGSGDCYCEAAFSIDTRGTRDTYLPSRSSGAQQICYLLSREETCKSLDGTALQALMSGTFCTQLDDPSVWKADGRGFLFPPGGGDPTEVQATSMGEVSILPNGHYQIKNYYGGTPFP